MKRVLAAVNQMMAISKNQQLVVLGTINAVLALLCYQYYAIMFNGDSAQYVRATLALSGNECGHFYYYRTIGYSVFLALLGLQSHQDFVWVLYAQIGLGVVAPMLTFLTLRNVGCRYAFSASLIVSLSFCTYIFSTLIMTDQLALAEMCMLLYLMSRAVAAGRLTWSNTLLSAGVGFALMATRPSAMLLWLCVFAPVAIATRPRVSGIIRFGTGLVLILACTWLLHSWQNRLTDAWYKNKKTPEGLEHFEWAGMEGKLLFWQMYGVVPHVVHTKMISAETGPHTLRMVGILETWARSNPMGIKSYLNADSPEHFVQLLFKEPDFFKHSVMWLALDQTVGPKAANTVMRRAAIEAIRKEPRSIQVFVSYFTAFFVVGDLEYNKGFGKINYEVFDGGDIAKNFGWREAWIDETLPGTMPLSIRELAQTRKPHLELDVGLFLALYALKLCCLALFGIAMLRMRKRFKFLMRPLVFSCVTVLVYQASVCSLFAAPCYRYWAPFLPIMVMLAALAVDCWRNPVEQEAQGLPVSGGPVAGSVPLGGTVSLL